MALYIVTAEHMHYETFDIYRIPYEEHLELDVEANTRGQAKSLAQSHFRDCSRRVEYCELRVRKVNDETHKL